MSIRGWVCILSIAGCGGEPAQPPHDMAAAHDLAMGDLARGDLAMPPDLAPPPPDMARTDDAGDVTQAHGAFHQYVVNRLLLPMQRSDYAIDLNGDNHADNQLGNVVGALEAQNIDPQASVDQSVASGSAVYLVSLQSADANLMNDNMVGFTFYTGVVQAMPDFSGMGMFTVDNGTPPAKLFGKLVNGKLATNDPVTTLKPVTVQLKIALIGGQPPVTLPVNGAHVQCFPGTDQASGAPGLLNGQLHGSVKESDVQTTLIPAIAQLLTATIVANPGSPQAMQIEQIFDTGGCGMAKANDMKIDPCEVAQNQIIQNILAPDVDIFDANGNYSPNPANTGKDSLSLGLGFTAVQAKF